MTALFRGACLSRAAERGRREEAQSMYVKAAQLDPTLAPAHHNLGSILRELGKPEQALAKIVEGKMTAFFKDWVLINQPFVKDDSKSIGELVDEVAAKVGEKIAIRRFARFELGEEVD